MQKLGEVLIITPFLGYGDLLYHTPLIKMLCKLYKGVDVWCYNTEPLLHNPYITNLFRIETDIIPNPWEFYFDNVYHMSGQHNQIFDQLHNTNMHLIDFYSLGVIHLCLRTKDKDLVLKWTVEDEKRIRDLIKAHEIDPNKMVIVNPTRGWPSRTMPKNLYKELIEKIHANGDRVVLVGKDVNPQGFLADNYNKETRDELKRNENKTLYPASEFPGAVDLMNKLTFHECAALYSMARAAINTENGNMVLSCTNYSCWNIYVPSLTAPEFRLPWRKGNQYYKTIVATETDRYPGSHYKNLREDYFLPEAEVKWPSVDTIYNAYKSIPLAGTAVT